MFGSLQHEGGVCESMEKVCELPDDGTPLSMDWMDVRSQSILCFPKERRNEGLPDGVLSLLESWSLIEAG